MFRAFRERDDETLFASYAPDIEWDLRDYSPWIDQPVFRGPDGVREFFRLWLQAFEGYQPHALDPVDVGEQVVVTILDRARGKRSGVPVERIHDQIWTLRDSLVVRVQHLDSRADALKAVGLEE